VENMAKIDNIEGIGPKYAKKLINYGIGTTDRLLLVAAHKRGREDLAEQTKIPGKLILEWVNLADLIRIKGIGEEYSNLLEEAGVDTVSELRQSHANNLYKSLVEINREKFLVRRIPSKRDVENWVKQAKSLKEVVRF
jgi:predicted flap endonuclease-1-like 5' DNA nuclease